jgi:asparagine synthase (glutamine-hydrolysing)
MCGLTGFLSLGDFDCEFATSTINKMVSALEHRGPDQAGTWMDGEQGIVLGHRRLAILDLSDAGKQPMVSHSGRYTMLLNGEVYNHHDIRSELRPHFRDWRGSSDTETILAAIDRWGILEAIKKCAGMFAIAIWDKLSCSLSLVRDRIGEKPLYYGWQGPTFLFGSELRALEKHPHFKFEIFEPVLSAFLQFSYVPSPWCIWTDIKKLEPGTIVTLSRKDRPECPVPISYWSLAEFIRTNSTFEMTDDEAVERLDRILTEVVSQEMTADVPVGAFLSGGIDSSLVVALMQKQNRTRVNTFSIGFDIAGFDEAPFAKKVASILGTNHTEMYVSSADAMEVIPQLPVMYDEPFGDSSQIPTHLVSKMARQNVTVALSGDGGDELFGGYSGYLYADKVIGMYSRVPTIVRNFAGSILGTVCGLDVMRNRLPEKYFKLAQVLKKKTALEMYREFKVQTFRRYVNCKSQASTFYESPEDWPQFSQLVEGMMFIDAMTSLPGDIMTKVDRATMSVSLESRAPLLDHRVVEFAWRLPLRMRIRDGQTKWILRRLLEQHLPRSVFERTKSGFAIPLAEWLRGSLKCWAGTLLSDDRIKSDGLFDSAAVNTAWQEHQNGIRDQSVVLWNIMMFHAWKDQVTQRRTNISIDQLRSIVSVV